MAGVARRQILELAQQQEILFVIDEFTLEDLLSAEEVFITNALLEVAPVTQIGQQRGTIGSMTRRFQESSNS